MLTVILAFLRYIFSSVDSHDRSTTSSKYPAVVPILGIALALLQVSVSVRMARVSFELKHIEVVRNPCDWSQDNVLATSHRVQKHPFSPATPKYDQCVLAIKLSLLLANMFLPNFQGGVVCIFMRVCLALCLLLAGLYYKKYFPGKVWNIEINMVQTTLDTSLVLANSFAISQVFKLPPVTAMTIVSIAALMVVLLALAVSKMNSTSSTMKEAFVSIVKEMLEELARRMQRGGVVSSSTISEGEEPLVGRV